MTHLQESGRGSRPCGPVDPPRVPGHMGEPATAEQAEAINGYWRRRRAWMENAEREFQESERPPRRFVGRCGNCDRVTDTLPCPYCSVLRMAVEALWDVLVDYNVPTGRILAEFKETIAAYMESA